MLLPVLLLQLKLFFFLINIHYSSFFLLCFPRLPFFSFLFLFLFHGLFCFVFFHVFLFFHVILFLFAFPVPFPWSFSFFVFSSHPVRQQRFVQEDWVFRQTTWMRNDLGNDALTRLHKIALAPLKLGKGGVAYESSPVEVASEAIRAEAEAAWGNQCECLLCKEPYLFSSFFPEGNDTKSFGRHWLSFYNSYQLAQKDLQAKARKSSKIVKPRSGRSGGKLCVFKFQAFVYRCTSWGVPLKPCAFHVLNYVFCRNRTRGATM